MQYNVKTPAEYLDTIEQDWRYEKLQEIRHLIQIKTPNLVEGIHYKMLSYSDEKGLIFSLNAQKNYVGLYFGGIKKIDPNGEFLKGLSCGKGCIRFKKTSSIKDSRIAEFIERAVEMWKRGEDIAC